MLNILNHRKWCIIRSKLVNDTFGPSGPYDLIESWRKFRVDNESFSFAQSMIAFPTRFVISVFEPVPPAAIIVWIVKLVIFLYD